MGGVDAVSLLVLGVCAEGVDCEPLQGMQGDLK